MTIARSLRLASLALLGAGFSVAGNSAAQATQFAQAELDQSRIIAIAAPFAGGSRHQLLVVEQLNNQRPCWRETGNNPTVVDPLLVQFDFTGICARSTDSNGYSIRMGGEDMNWRYSLQVVQRGSDLILVGVPTTGANSPDLEIGRTRGVTTGFAKIYLNPEWRLTRRAFNNQATGHVYLTHNQTLSTVLASAGSSIYRPQPPAPTTPPTIGTRPSVPIPVPSPVVPSRPVIPPAPPTVSQPRPGSNASNDYVVPTIVIGGSTRPVAPSRPLPTPTYPSGNVPIPVPPPEDGLGTIPVPSLPPSGNASNPAAMGFNYRVIVTAATRAQQARVQQLVPGAFRTMINGQTVMQAGLFRDRPTAEALLQQLLQNNLSASILPITSSSGGWQQVTNPIPNAIGGGGLFNLPEPTGLGQATSLWATYYNTHRAVPVSQGYPLLDMAGNSLGIQLSQKDWCAAAVEGSVQIMGSQSVLGTYNFAGRGDRPQVDCSPFYPTLRTLQATNRVRFRLSNTLYGEGAGGNELVPYRTIAVDRTRIPIGSAIYIPAARGTQVTLPSGETVVHDGYFYAADVGNAVRGNQIDVYVGTSTSNPFSFVRSNARNTFEAYVVNDPNIRQALASMHRRTNANARL